ncbi:FAD-dependent oxidoreductase [Streptomyces arenae]|uniref:FAD-dependent oxidoreductase n=1 Tax=Streptomyces arenae TaxID=29301 RepID=UPI002658FC0F|nr:FAD-dependent oxidoreductase [Streptomyces arenae]MCG7205570.1 FAD-dependent oxidoreductase [Streptomyces arenae]
MFTAEEGGAGTDVVEDVDLLVVGGGKAGKSLAMDTARAGRRVLMVEKSMTGGSCVNVRIPTKTLVTSARLAPAGPRDRPWRRG